MPTADPRLVPLTLFVLLPTAAARDSEGRFRLKGREEPLEVVAFERDVRVEFDDELGRRMESSQSLVECSNNRSSWLWTALRLRRCNLDPCIGTCQVFGDLARLVTGASNDNDPPPRPFRLLKKTVREPLKIASFIPHRCDRCIRA